MAKPLVPRPLKASEVPMTGRPLQTIQPKLHNKTVVGIPPAFQKTPKPMQAPGEVMQMPKLPGC